MLEPKWRIKSRKGGIEGLPLQLMIMVVVAGIGTAILMGWMSGLQAPSTISEVHTAPPEIVLNDQDGDGIYNGDIGEFTVSVLDQQGDGISGATVVLEGAGVSKGDSSHTVHGMTDSGGMATFSGLHASHSGSTLTFMTVTVTKNGYGDHTTDVPVICE